MGINEIIIWIIIVFMILGGIDYCLDNKMGLGEKFEEGILAMGALALSMAGIIVIAPVLADVLTPVVGPVFSLFGADPAMLGGTILANDMGGYKLAEAMTQNIDIVKFSGSTLGSMMGATLVFTIPVSVGIIEKEDQEFLATGILCGLMSIPFGAIVGGILQGMNILTILQNLIPIIIVAILVALGLWKAPNAMIKGFKIFGKGIVIIAVFGLILGALDLLVGVKPIANIDTIESAFLVVGTIAVTLAGAYGLVFAINKFFKTPLMKVGSLIGMNDVAAAGLVASLANNIAMFQTLKDMNRRGKVLNVAFAVCASFTFGDHLGFTAGVASDMILPMIVSKLFGGVVAIVIASFVVNNMYKDKPEETV